MSILRDAFVKRSIPVVLIFGSILCGTGLGDSARSSGGAKRDPNEKRIVHASPPDSTVDDRNRRIDALARKLEKLPSHSRHYQPCAEELGRLHTDKASPILIKYLTVSGAFTGGTMPLEGFPCAYELSRLGSVAYPAIFHKLDRDCSELELAVLAHVMLHIDGRELAEARLRIEMRPPVPLSDPRARSVNRRSDQFRANAQQALDLLADPKFVYREIAAN